MQWIMNLLSQAAKKVTASGGRSLDPLGPFRVRFHMFKRRRPTFPLSKTQAIVLSTIMIMIRLMIWSMIWLKTGGSRPWEDHKSKRSHSCFMIVISHGRDHRIMVHDPLRDLRDSQRLVYLVTHRASRVNVGICQFPAVPEGDRSGAAQRRSSGYYRSATRTSRLSRRR